MAGSCEHGNDPSGLIKCEGSTSFSRRILLHTVSTVLNRKYSLVHGRYTAHILAGICFNVVRPTALSSLQKRQGLLVCQCGFLPVTTVTSHIYSVPVTLTCVEVITQPLKKRKGFFPLPFHPVPLFPCVLFSAFTYHVYPTNAPWF